MEISKDAFKAANWQAADRLQNTPIATGARYDRGANRVVIALSSGIEVAFANRDYTFRSGHSFSEAGCRPIFAGAARRVPGLKTLDCSANGQDWRQGIDESEIYGGPAQRQTRRTAEERAGLQRCSVVRRANPSIVVRSLADAQRSAQASNHCYCSRSV